MPREMVFFEVEEMNRFAYIYSSQQVMKENKPVAMMPGLAMGRITRNSAVVRLAPSMQAASSSSQGS